MHSAAFMGVSATVHFPSLLFSVANSLITIASLHHHRNPLFSKKNGQNQASAASLLCLLEPLFSISGGGFQFQGDKVRVVHILLFVEGINTLLQTLFGTRLPIVMGGSYAVMVPIISIIHDSKLASIEDPHLRFVNTMRAVQGAMIVASSLQIILGFSQLWAICSRIFSPLGMVPVIALSSFGLFNRGFPVVGRCVEIGIPMLLLFIVFSQYLKNFNARQLPMLERSALLISATKQSRINST